MSNWKSSVKEIGAGLDKCREQLDRLDEQREEAFQKREIFRNANTLIEISVKRKGSNSRCNDSTEDQHIRRKPHDNKKKPICNEEFSDESWSQKLLKENKNPRRLRNVAAVDEMDDVIDRNFALKNAKNNRKNTKRHKRYQEATVSSENRLCGIAKSDEMEIRNQLINAIQNGNQNLALKLLENIDIPYPIDSRGNASKKVKKNVSSSIDPVTVQLRKEWEEFHKENMRLQKELTVSRDEVKKQSQLVADLEKQICDLKHIITRLTTNNTEMLAVLSSGEFIDETVTKSMHQLEAQNQQLQQKLDVEREKNLQINSLSRKRQTEVHRLHSVIQDLKSSLNRDLNEFVDRPRTKDIVSDNSTIDLGLSTTQISDANTNQVEPDEEIDSAIASETHRSYTPPSHKITTSEEKTKLDLMMKPRVNAIIDEAKAVNEIVNNIDHEVQDFLSKMRTSKFCAPPLPGLPMAKSSSTKSIQMDFTIDSEKSNE